MKPILWIEPDLLAQFKGLDAMTGLSVSTKPEDQSEATYRIVSSDLDSKLESSLQSSLQITELKQLSLIERAPKDNGKGFKEKLHIIDINKFLKAQKTFPASKKDLVARAVTGGWGGDTLHMCRQGYEVTKLERHPILASFLNNAFSLLAESEWVERHSVAVPIAKHVNSIEYLKCLTEEGSADCIYLDPMFPEKRKSSALAKKNMQVLHDLVGKDEDQEALFAAAYQSPVKRIAVKRPPYAESLGSELGVSPSEQIKGKLLVYDIYLK